MSQRYVVVDLNVICDGTWSEFLQPSDSIVLPNEAIGDILKSNDWKLHARKYGQFLAEYQDRTFAAHIDNLLEKVEFERQSPITGDEWIDRDSTRIVRSIDARAVRWEEFRQASVIEHYVKSIRPAFMDYAALVKQTAEEQRNGTATKLKSGIDIAKTWIREPFWGGFMPPAYRAEYQTPIWKKRLEVFPDVYAAGRLSRVNSWYGLKFTAGHTRGLQNSCEDAGYAFTASYAGHLVTKDKGLRECVQAVFPQVQLVEP
ncbi:MAG: hypothetical protein ACTHN5_14065 [Phycisphaerae bacterium]